MSSLSVRGLPSTCSGFYLSNLNALGGDDQRKQVIKASAAIRRASANGLYSSGVRNKYFVAVANTNQRRAIAVLKKIGFRVKDRYTGTGACVVLTAKSSQLRLS